MKRSLSSLLLSIVDPDYGKCFPKDSDACLQRASSWSSSYDCGSVRDYLTYCTTWEKDTRRCCPESCRDHPHPNYDNYPLYPFTKWKCQKSTKSGECDYTPVLYTEGAQCEVVGIISGNILVFVTRF